MGCSWDRLPAGRVAGAKSQGPGGQTAQLGIQQRSHSTLYLLSWKDQPVLPKHSSELVDVERLETVPATQTTTGCSHMAQVAYLHAKRGKPMLASAGGQPDACSVTFSFLYQL